MGLCGLCLAISLEVHKRFPYIYIYTHIHTYLFLSGRVCGRVLYPSGNYKGFGKASISSLKLRV